MIMMDTGYQPTVRNTHTIPSPAPSLSNFTYLLFSPSLGTWPLHFLAHHTFYTLPHLPQSQPIIMTCSIGSHFFSTMIEKEMHNSSGKQLRTWDSNYSITLNPTSDNYQSFNDTKTLLDVFGENCLLKSLSSSYDKD